MLVTSLSLIAQLIGHDKVNNWRLFVVIHVVFCMYKGGIPIEVEKGYFNGKTNS